MTQRKGLGKGLGMGYKNLVQKDPYIHSLSARGIKQKVYPKVIIVNEDNQWVATDGNTTLEKAIANYKKDKSKGEYRYQKRTQYYAFGVEDENYFDAKGKKETDYSETLLPDKEGKYTRQQEHIAFLRGIAQKEDLDNYDLFVEFMDKRFPHEWNPEYIATWVRRFKSGDPLPYMDGESRRTYTSVLKRKYKMDAKRKKSKLIKVQIYDKDTGEVVETKELTQKGFEGFLYYFSAQAGENYKFRVVDAKGKISLSEIKEKINAESVSKKEGVITAKLGYYYSKGRKTEDFVKTIKEEFPNAEILESGDIYKPQWSHWYVKFKL